jgi:hypothetical protein
MKKYSCSIHISIVLPFHLAPVCPNFYPLTCRIPYFQPSHPFLCHHSQYFTVRPYFFFLPCSDNYTVLTLSLSHLASVSVPGCIRHLLSSRPPPFLRICCCRQIQKRACGVREGAASGLEGVDGSLDGWIYEGISNDKHYSRIFTEEKQLSSRHRMIALTTHHIRTPFPQSSIHSLVYNHHPQPTQARSLLRCI